MARAGHKKVLGCQRRSHRILNPVYTHHALISTDCIQLDYILNDGAPSCADPPLCLLQRVPVPSQGIDQSLAKRNPGPETK